MKKIISIITLLLVLSSSSLFSQENKDKITYSFINEYGLFFGGGVNEGTIGLTSVFVNGIKCNDINFYGIGIGYESDLFSGQSIPMFFNYRHFFPSNKKLKPLINVALGARFSYWTESNIILDYYGNIIYEDIQRNAFGFYSTVAAGFNVNAFSFTSGLFLKSVQEHFIAGFEVKAGFTL